MEGSITAGGVNALYPDENGNLWICSDGDIGVARATLAESLLYALPVAHSGVVEDIETVNAGTKKYYAVCSWHGTSGLILLDENLNEVRTFAHVPEDAGDDAVNVSSVAADTKSRLWVSSWKGITVMDNSFRVLKKLDNTTKSPDTLFGVKNNFAIISNDSVWIATYKHGIDLFNTDFKKLKHYSAADNNGLMEDLIWKFYRAKNGTIWLSGNAFVYRFDAAREKFVPYFFQRTEHPATPLTLLKKEMVRF